MNRSSGVLACLLSMLLLALGCELGGGGDDERPPPDRPPLASERFVRLPPVEPVGGSAGRDPVPQTAEVVRLAPIPWTVVRACRRFQAQIRVPMLCPSVLPRPLLSSLPGYPPEVLGSEMAGRNELHIGYGAETPQGVRGHRWRNRPCCFLHFVIGQREAPLPPDARPGVLGGIRGRLLPATGEYFEGPYFGNHVRFFFRRGGVDYVATLHTFGNRATTRLLGRLLAELRPVAELRAPPDPVARTVRTGSVGTLGVAVGAGGVWAASAGDLLHGFTTPTRFTRPALVRIDAGTGRVAATIRAGRYPRTLAVGAGGVWVAGLRGNQGVVTRVDPERNRVVAVIRTGSWPRSVAADASGVWVVNSAPFYRRGTLVRIDPGTNRISGRPIQLGQAPSGLALGAGRVWVADAVENTVTGIDVATGSREASIGVGRRPYGLAFAAGSVWVTNSDDGTVSRIDPIAKRVVSTIRVGLAPHGVAVGHGSVWVTNLGDGTLSRIEPATNRVARSIYLGGEPLAVAAGESAVWVTSNSEGTVVRLDPRSL